MGCGHGWSPATPTRRLVIKAFTSRAVERMQHHIEAIADELLDNIDRRDATKPVDLVTNYAAPLPIRVICELLGMPTHYAERFRAAFHPLVNIARHAAKEAAARDTIAVLTDLIEYKRQGPATTC